MASLARIASLIDDLNERAGRFFSWLTLFMVLVQFIVVLQRYVFGIGSIWAQESITYMHGTTFMAVAGYTLLHNAHVRVDVFYRAASSATKAWVDLLGTVFLMWPVCILIFYVSYPYIATSWASLESSRETSGIQGVYLLKSMIFVFVILLALQGISTVIHALRILAGSEEPAEEASPIL
tara:strand:+ start:813 stop:1352 length:540 start_codon:yes stop_codon:yes gene_type:complete